MQLPTDGKAVLIAEADADWSPWLELLQDRANDVLVVVQQSGEAPPGLASRARAMLADYCEETELAAAAIVGGARCDHTVLTSRSQMVCAILAHMSSASGSLYLDGGASAQGSGRHAMKALASALGDQVSHGIAVHAGVPGGTSARSQSRAAA